MRRVELRSVERCVASTVSSCVAFSPAGESFDAVPLDMGTLDTRDDAQAVCAVFREYFVRSVSLFLSLIDER